MAAKSVTNYLKVQMNTAGAGKRVVMMYDGIIKNLRSVLYLMKHPNPEDMEKINNQIQLAEQLIMELKMALDMTNGGEISENLTNLYEFWVNHLSEANIQKDARKIDEVLKMVVDLRGAWDQAAKEARKMGIG